MAVVEILEAKYAPIPVAKKILESMGSIIEENPVVARTYEYIAKFSKCSPEAAEEALGKLVEEGFSEFAASILINIVPASVEEAKAILGDIDGGYDDSVVEKALEILKESCGQE
ncbi:hypothetical protein PABY_02820 [Pyrodictium abyssi]|uniref:DNA-directed RNA polymerase subunit Rpo4 n=1 Tax=Pyrodictium abyssi TaxID=54256 RepID=A0ABM8IT24_9CREN|nr:hypothetical protein PABY_02820 [Pyrodictium abyssi]